VGYCTTEAQRIATSVSFVSLWLKQWHHRGTERTENSPLCVSVVNTYDTTEAQSLFRQSRTVTR